MKRKHVVYLSIALTLLLCAALPFVVQSAGGPGAGYAGIFARVGSSGAWTWITRLNGVSSLSGGNATITNGAVANASANTVWSGPTSGAAAAPAFRALVAADIPATPLATFGENTTATAPRGYYVHTGAAFKLTLPTPAAGYEFCVMQDMNVSTAITVAVPGTVYLENTDRASYTTVGYSLVSAGAAGEKLCVVGRDATHYLTISYSGTWTATAP